MNKIVALQQKIAPEFSTTVERRYSILRNIYFSQPVGRRSLALNLKAREREVRNEVDFLRGLGFIYADPAGMRLTPEGEDILWELRDYVAELRGLADLEDFLEDRLALPRVTVVPGNSDEDPTVKNELGRVTARLLKDLIKDGDIIAVTGGTTVAAVAEAVALSGLRKNVTVVPARGGLGDDVETQSDTISARMAKGLGGTYRLLSVPEDLSPEAGVTLMNEPRVREVLDTMRLARLVIYGMGTAEELAKRRRLPPELVSLLRARGAVAEAFGYYFDRDGKTVHVTTSMGLRLEDLSGIQHLVAVGGGKSKALAVISVMRGSRRDILITDEGAARSIRDILMEKSSWI